VRAVADTDVYIFALNFGGTPEEILGLGRARTIQLFISPSILEEIEEVLLRKFYWSARNIREATTAIQELAQLIHPREAIHLITEDEPDNRILECAVEANADCVITGDRHLRQLKTFRGIPIVNSREFIGAYGARDLGG
jgi:putative PIN family toxin of toxin-antitoxin system